jgi:hypothetical protein
VYSDYGLPIARHSVESSNSDPFSFAVTSRSSSTAVQAQTMLRYDADFYEDADVDDDGFDVDDYDL